MIPIELVSRSGTKIDNDRLIRLLKQKGIKYSINELKQIMIKEEDLKNFCNWVNMLNFDFFCRKI
jgi:hypothetical protein